MILVTGGRGFVGRHLVEALSGGTEAVRVLTRSVSLVVAREGVSFIEGDLMDTRSLERAVNGARAVIHLAARLASPPEPPAALYAFNVGSTAALAAAARAAGVEHFIHMSSGGVYGDGRQAESHRETDSPCPGNAYERSKLDAEGAVTERLRGSRVRCTILRPAGIYGAGRAATQAFFDEVRHRRMWLLGYPNVIVHPTHVSDVVQACVRTLDAGSDAPQLLNVAGERPLRFQELVTLAAEALGVRVRQLAIPGLLGRPLGRAIAGSFRLVGAPVPGTIDRAQRRWVNRGLDTSLARRLLGFAPVTLRDGLRETVEASRREAAVRSTVQ